MRLEKECFRLALLALAGVTFAVSAARGEHRPREIRWCSMRVLYHETVTSAGPLYNDKNLHGLAEIACPGEDVEGFVLSADGRSAGEGLAHDSSFHRTPGGIEGRVLIGIPASERLHGLRGSFRSNGSIGNVEAGAAAEAWLDQQGRAFYFPVGWMYPSLARDGRVDLRRIELEHGERTP